MTDLDALLAAVIHRPADDTPRLAYADHCDDLAGSVACPACALDKRPGVPGGLAYVSVGDTHRWASCPTCRGTGSVSNGYAERAEFVRVQVELARLPDECDVYCDDNPRRPMNALRVGVCTLHHHRRELRRRERELFDAHKAAWFGGDRWAVLLLPDDDADLMPDLTTVVVRRGFVDEIRCDLRTFVGGECRCLLEWETTRNYVRAGRREPQPDCPDCAGTGRVGLDLAAVFSRWPVQRVVIVGSEPWHNTGAGVYVWLAMTDNYSGGNDAARIPAELWPYLREGDIRLTHARPTRAAALDALSAACVAYGRSAAGLPAL